MEKLAKIVNQFGKEFKVPLYLAKQMLARDEIDNLEIIGDGEVANLAKPQTQTGFERTLGGDNSGTEVDAKLVTTNKMMGTKLKNANAKEKELQAKIEKLEAKIETEQVKK